MSDKTFYVITEEYYEDMDIHDKNVLYAFETQEEALYVLHLLKEEDTGHFYRYDLSIVNNKHPYEKLSEEEMLSLRRERDAHKRAKEEIEKQKEEVKLLLKRFMKSQYEIDKKKAEEEHIEKKKQETEAECQECKEKIDDFMEWLKQARKEIAIYDPNKEDDEQLHMTLTDYQHSAENNLSLIKKDIQQYLLVYQDEQIMELVNKPICELLNLPPTAGSQNPSLYVPKRLRQLMEQDK